MSNTEARVRAIIVEGLGAEESDVTLDATFQDDLGADSLDTMELVMQFEEEFNIEFSDEEVKKIATVREAVEYIDSQVGG